MTRTLLAGLLAYLLLAVVVFGMAALVLLGVDSINNGPVDCVTVRVAPAEVDCTWRGDR